MKNILFFFSLTILILTARGGEPGLGQEELPAGTDTHLEEALSIPRILSFVQRQVRHPHRLGVQHQLTDRHTESPSYNHTEYSEEWRRDSHLARRSVQRVKVM